MSVSDDVFAVPSPQSAYSTPIDSPLNGPPPGRFADGEVLTVQYRTDPAAIRALLPEPLVPTNDTVMVQIARWGDVGGLGRDTHEANVMVGACLGELTGSYSPYFWVTSDRAMAGGRELHGQPKRLGSVTLEHRGDLTARATPLGPVVDDDRLLVLHDLGVEVRVGHDLGCAHRGCSFRCFGLC